jgi:hypothetical protein
MTMTDNTKTKTMKDKDTYHARAEADLETGGRWAKPTIGVPELPAASPWSRDPVGIEPPLGIDVNAMEPVGEHHEVERSLRAAQQEEVEGDV